MRITGRNEVTGEASEGLWAAEGEGRKCLNRDEVKEKGEEEERRRVIVREMRFVSV